MGIDANGSPWNGCLEIQLIAPGVVGATLSAGGARLTFSQVMSLWRDDVAFVVEWVTRLAAVPFDAYCLETPPLRRRILNEPFECVLVESPLLARIEADPLPFQEHFRASGGSVVFPSLGKDALLVAPCPVNDSTCYAHLAAFLRSASKEEACQLWKTVALGLDDRLGEAFVWLSTAGLGVSWLHVRLDSRPKYYRYRAYAAAQYWGGKT
jgi:hypothetical protein